MWFLFSIAFAQSEPAPTTSSTTTTGAEAESTNAEATDTEATETESESGETEAKDTTTEAGTADPEEVYTLPTLDFELPSALESNSLEAPPDDGSFAAVTDQIGPLGFGFDERDYKLAKLLQGGIYLRPRLAFSQLIGNPGPIAVRMGATLGYRFGGRARTVQWTGDVNLRATAPVGGASGHRVEFNGLVGPWVSRLRLQVGVHSRWERERWRKKLVEAETALYLGPNVQLGVDAEVVQFLFGVAPTWKLAGNRDPASVADPLFPDFAHETTWLVGLAVPLNAVRLQGDATYRDTEIGGLFEVSVGFHVSLPGLLGAAFGGNTKEDS